VTKTPRTSEDEGAQEQTAAQDDELRQSVDAQPEVKTAEKAVDRAREQLREAEEYYRKARQKASEQVERVRQTTLGDMIDGVLDIAKKYPGPSVAVAALFGFFLGRLFRR